MSIVVNKTRLPVTNWVTKSGAIVSIDDARQRDARSLKVHMLPQQDLHGYDNPWPAGGGSQIINEEGEGWSSPYGNISSTFSTGVWTITNTHTNGRSGVLSVGTLKAGVYYAGVSAMSSTVQVLTFKKTSDNSTILQITAGSNVGTFTLSEDTECYIQHPGFDVGTNTISKLWLSKTNSGYSPYSNLCPISGYQSVVGYRTGVNVWDEEWESGYYNISTGEKKESSANIRCKNPIHVVPNTSYYLKWDNSNSAYINVQFRDANGDFISNSVLINPLSFNIPNNCHYITFYYTNGYGTTYKNDTSLNYPATDHDYHAYTGTTYSVTFPCVGKNQWDEEWEVGAINDNTGQNQNNSNKIRSKNYIPVTAGNEYYFVTGLVLFGYDANKDVVQIGSSTLYAVASGKYTIPNGVHYVRFYPSSGVYGNTYKNDITINYPSSVTTYEPYTNTVYGGALDVTEGKLNITMGMVDMGTLPWQIRESLGGFSATVTPTPKNQFKAISSCYPYKGVYSSVTDKSFGYVYNNHVFIKDSAYSDATTLKTSLNGQTLVYELATPITIRLTPQQIQMLVRNNTIWSDADSVEVEYAAIHSH